MNKADCNVVADHHIVCVRGTYGCIEMHLDTTRFDGVLNEAHRLIYGDREQDYGHPRENLGMIAEFWQTYLERMKGRALEPRDVCNLMVLLKVARDFGGAKRDTDVDIAGYAGLKERVTIYPDTL